MDLIISTEANQAPDTYEQQLDPDQKEITFPSDIS